MALIGKIKPILLPVIVVLGIAIAQFTLFYAIVSSRSQDVKPIPYEEKIVLEKHVVQTVGYPSTTYLIISTDNHVTRVSLSRFVTARINEKFESQWRKPNDSD